MITHIRGYRLPDPLRSEAEYHRLHNLDLPGMTTAELAREGLPRFDLAAFREGHLTPVYFGSALRRFGIL